MSSLTREAQQEVERLIREGHKLQAIKYIHDTFSVSLSDAKLLVDAAEREMTTASAPLASTTTSLADSSDAEVERLLRAHKKIEAVKYVHTLQRTGLKEALRRVEEVQRRIDPNFAASHSRKNTSSRLIVLLFGLIGVLLFGIAGVIFYLQQNVIDKGATAEGVVVSLRQDSEGTYAPVIVYRWNEQEYTYVSTTYTNPPAYEENEHVTLFLNPDDPGDIVIDSFSERWLAIVIVGGIGTVFTFFSILFLFVFRKF